MIRWAIYQFLLVVSSNDVSRHHCRDITTFTVYMTACDLEKSFSFDATLEITGHIVALRLMSKHIVASYSELQSHT